MIKTKFGGAVRSKTSVAQVNEVLCKILCHNICVLIQSMYELDFTPLLGTGGETEGGVGAKASQSTNLHRSSLRRVLDRKATGDIVPVWLPPPPELC